MRAITDLQARVYASNRARYDVRVWIKDALGTSVNLGSFLGGGWVRGVEWGEDVDSPGMDATITLGRAKNRLSLAPGRTASAANLTGTLLAPAREIWIEAAVVPSTRAVQAGDWIEVFRGQVQEVDWGDPSEITLTAIGLQGLLQAAWITTVSAYGSSGGTAVEDVIQAILDDWAPSPVPTLSTPTSPGWMIAPAFQSQIQSVWNEIMQCSDSLGWCLRYLWDEGSSSWKLTLYAPDRSLSGAKYALSPSRWLAISKASDSLDNVRNEVAITYPDSTNLDASGQGTPATYTATDATSIATYGLRWMGITLDATSLIDTEAEATAMAEAILADVAYPKTAWEIVIPYFHAVELGDILTLEADHIWLDADTDVTVVGYRHKLSEELRTTIQCRADGAVSHSTGWLERSAQRGVSPLLQVSAPLDPTDYPPIVEQTMGGIKFSPDGYQIPRKGGYQIEVHCGPTGFTPDYNHGSATFLGRTKASAFTIQADASRLPIGETLDFVVVYLNDRGVRSAPYTISSSALRPGLGFFSNLVRFAGSFPGSTFSFQSRGIAYPPDGWNMSIGAWGSGAELVESGSFGPQTGKYSMMLSTSNEIEVLSETFPVAVRRKYTSQFALKADTLDTISVSVEWLDSSGSVLSTDTIMYGSVGIVDTWETRKRTHSPPESARYARCRINKPAVDMKVTLDRLLFEEDPEREDAPQRILLDDDFAGADGDTIGSLGWGLYVGVEDPDPGPASVAKQAASDWRRIGIVVLSVADVTSYPQVTYSLALGTYGAPTFYGVPPAGTEMSWVVSMESATADVTAWCGVWSDATQAVGPDSAPAAEPVQVGIGFVARAGAWYGVVRVNSGGTYVNHEVDLGIDADTTWRRLGWRIVNESDVQFFVGDVAVGAVQSTDSLDGGLSPIFGLIATGTTDTPGIRVDRVTLSTLLDRDTA